MKLIFSILLVYTILFASEDITISSADNALYEKFIFNDLIANKNNFKTNNNGYRPTKGFFFQQYLKIA